jgi:hypothetical protein
VTFDGRRGLDIRDDETDMIMTNIFLFFFFCFSSSLLEKFSFVRYDLPPVFMLIYAYFLNVRPFCNFFSSPSSHCT